MQTYLERYLNGECAEVWADLTGLGGKVRRKSFLLDAEAVADETMRRARQNLEILIPRLAAVGYRFAAPALERRLEHVSRTIAVPKLGPYVRRQIELAIAAGKADASALDPANNKALQLNLITYREEKAALEAELKRMKALPPLENPRVFYEPERQTHKYLKLMEQRGAGPIPMSLRAWYKHVGYISFMGSHEVLNPPGNAIADPLVVVSLPDFYKSLCYADPGDKKRVALSPDDLGKAGLPKRTPSLDSPLEYKITIPNAAADFKFENEWHATHFVEYLRRALQWAGFPGWERGPNPPREWISKLTEGLVPI
jgi:hypothetical protein